MPAQLRYWFDLQTANFDQLFGHHGKHMLQMNMPALLLHTVILTNNAISYIHSKGISQSALPYRRTVPSWLKLNAEDVKDQIKKLGKKGLTPSKIGMCIIVYNSVV